MCSPLTRLLGIVHKCSSCPVSENLPCCLMYVVGLGKLIVISYASRPILKLRKKLPSKYMGNAIMVAYILHVDYLYTLIYQ